MQSKDGSLIVQQRYSGKYTFMSQRPRTGVHLYGDDPLGLRKSTQFPFSKRLVKRKKRRYTRRTPVTKEAVKSAFRRIIAMNSKV